MSLNSARPLSVDDITREIRLKLGSPKSSYSERLLATTLRFANVQSQNSVDLHDLLELDDEEFLVAAYLVILDRSVDPNGRQAYLNSLGSRVSKVTILSQLRYSAEGEKVGRTIRGLPKRYMLYRLRQYFRSQAIGQLALSSLRRLRTKRRIK